MVQRGVYKFCACILSHDLHLSITGGIEDVRTSKICFSHFLQYIGHDGSVLYSVNIKPFL